MTNEELIEALGEAVRLRELFDSVVETDDREDDDRIEIMEAGGYLLADCVTDDFVSAVRIMGLFQRLVIPLIGDPK